MNSPLQTPEAWRNIHQPFELDWWKTALAAGHSMDDAAFAAHWQPAKDFIKPTGRVLDIGCGPRPPFKPCYVIEPLALEYQKITPSAWWEDVGVYAQPAEVQIPELTQAFDTVICWNCIDHAIGWRKILANMRSYGRPDASTKYAIATDFHPPFTGHPGFDREEFMAELGKHFWIVEKREPFERQLAMLLR
jgi:hypothetical protein